jgi:hypothetical protein
MDDDWPFRTIADALARQAGEAPRGLRLKATPLTGGLVSESVQSVAAHYADGGGRARVDKFVLKRLTGQACREADVYKALSGTSIGQLAPVLIGINRQMDGTVRLIVQQLVPGHPWPWRDARAVSSVLHTLAALHAADAAATFTAQITDWNFELELEERAARLIVRLENARVALREAGIELRLPMIRRLAAGLPGWRRQLLSFSPLPTTVIHGDVHSGNVVLPKPKARPAAILIDWERARLGSPLEDVSSWLQSLGFWEPVARRRHDTLLGEYLRARGLSRMPTRDLRNAYWLAAASNCLGGSLEYHVEVATTREMPEPKRVSALRAVRDQLRILRRAEACAN